MLPLAYSERRQVYLREMLNMMEGQLKVLRLVPDACISAMCTQAAGPAVPQGFSVREAAAQLCSAGRIDTEELKSVAALAGFDLEDLGLLQLA